MKRLSSVLRLGSSGQEILNQLRNEFHLPPTPRYLSAGDRAPRTGVYSVFHRHLCTLAPSSVFVTVGQSLLRCFHCGDGVLYRLETPL